MNRDNILTKSLIIPFIKVWNLFFDISLHVPKSIEKEFRQSGGEDSYVLYFIPIIGLTLGLSAYVFSWIVSIIGGTVFAAVLCPIIIVLTWDLLNHAKDTNYLVHYIYFKIFREHDNNSADIQQHSENNFMIFYIFTAIFIIRVLCLGVLIFFHHLGWIVVTAVLAYAIQGHLAADRKAVIKMWIVTAVLCLLFGAVYFSTLVLAFIITLLIAVKAKSSFERTGSLSGANIGFTGKYTEIIVLLLGLLFRFYF